MRRFLLLVLMICLGPPMALASPLHEAAKTGDLGKAAGLPVFLEGLLNEKPLLGGQRTPALDSFIIQEFSEREGKHLP